MVLCPLRASGCAVAEDARYAKELLGESSLNNGGGVVMKTLSARSSASIIILVAVMLLVAASAGAGRKCVRLRSPAAARQEVPVVSGNSYSDVLNGLFSAGR